MNSSSFIENLRSEINKEITNYYQNLKYEINIEAQIKLIEYELENDDENDSGDDDFLDDYIANGLLLVQNLSPERLIEKNELFRINKYLIDQVTSIMDMNLTQINEYFDANINSIDDNLLNCLNKETIKSKALTKSCTFIGNSNLIQDLKFENYAGLFMTYDWYLNANEINYVK